MASGRRELHRARLSRFDGALLDFAERWAPYDGGHEFILAEFGLTLGEYYRRLREVLSQLDAGDRDPRVVAAARHHDAIHNGQP
ncbi:DUF3263 domain-containing protein [Antrihabitans spumae]|uniref:DUF3263 domain-containing protein n=1 Tax=Antrihabitans spumae TaxID=3373370 RepID=A0ABW7JUA9_9NOCA